jgi:Rrf2 family protein
MLTKKAKYALKALSLLASNGKPMPIADIAQKERIPKKFLEVILVELKKSGLLLSNRGRIGGYQLLKKPEEISIGKVIRIIDGSLANLPCASTQAYKPCAECADPETCTIRLTMIKVRDATAQILDHTSIADLQRHPYIFKFG